MLVYFAGPLFSEAEKRFNQQLTDRLEAIGYRVFLPQRDGVEKHKSPYDQMSRDERRRAMFDLDTAKVLEAEIFLFVLDGRIPDEGACVELGIAYCHKQMQNNQKLIIGLHTDARAAFLGAKLNPMLSGAFDQIAESETALLSILTHYRKE